jgi:hypothetical protein
LGFRFRCNTAHVIGNSNIISRLKYVIVAPMTVVRGEAYVVVGKWGVFVKFPNGEIKRIDGVFYISNIKWNLFFVGCISDQGYTIEFIKSICIIRDMQIHTIVGKGHMLERRGLNTPSWKYCKCWNLQCGIIVEHRKKSTMA